MFLDRNVFSSGVFTVSLIVCSLYGIEARAQAPDSRIPFGVKSEEEQVDPDPGHGILNRPAAKPLAARPFGVKSEEEQVDPDPGQGVRSPRVALAIQDVCLRLLLEGAPPSIVEAVARMLWAEAAAARLAAHQAGETPALPASPGQGSGDAGL